jgi:RimJ/RimL family protein N-acetyltransferase
VTDREQLTNAFDRQSIRAERVFLRPLEPDDVDLIHRWHQDIALRRLGGSPPRSLAGLRARFEQQRREERGEGFDFIICLIEDGRPIGRLDLFDIDRLNGSVALGVEIGERDLWGKGYGTEAVSAALDFAFGELRLERVWLGTAANNVRAQRSYEKSGFVVEARLRNAFVERGGLIDEIRMAILRDEWLALDRKRSWEYVADS